MIVTRGEFKDGVFVEDDGVGIPENEREVVFDNTHSIARTTGLGLAIVQEMGRPRWEVILREPTSGGAD